ncbi:pantothenate kinase [Nostocaceae cyanobacterium CENA369]|uniref:Type III pantothenate kinase n=1 Tax=Dendronalium phyllosphericum CENA369 TaxID=1725256 RepID=A0A8J7I501_9NOST|nr:pantothenate kinase [Dendronalium phyllosphericum]MBH8572652.1 pantothenate kinase [Dendronalium phyllosphericum CENA369]
MCNIKKIWLALEIGNSQLHWALFNGEILDFTWDTEYLPESVISQLAQCQTLNNLLLAIFPLHQRTEVQREQKEILAEAFFSSPPLFLASVVPSQTTLWQTYPNIRVITLDQIPLRGVYPTLGIDRALALWGAGKTWGFPMLVIDAGTALTFTGADDNQCLVGGAILPGLGLQIATLGQKTGQLPLVETPNSASLPTRFALNTPEAIQSGIIYTLIAGIKDFIEAWWCLFPEGKIAIKGGDRTLLFNYLQTLYPAIASHLIVELNLTFWGMREIAMS